MYVNFIAVILAALVAMAVGFFWYSPYGFGKRWMANINIKQLGYGEDVANMPHGKFSPTQAMGIEFISLLVMSFVLANLALALGTHSIFASLRLGFWVWLGFQATILFSSVLFERRPLQLFYLNAAQRLVAMLLMAVIVGLWR